MPNEIEIFCCGCTKKVQARLTDGTEIKNARQYIHRLLDPMWKSGRWSRREIYRLLSDHIGRRYHTAQIRSVDEARKIYAFLKKLEHQNQ